MHYTFIEEYYLWLPASGPGRCKVNNGGCWHEARDGHAFTACTVSDLYAYFFFFEGKFLKKKKLSESKLSFKSCFSEQDDGGVKCKCPPGFKGDGVKSCEGKRNETS